MSEAAFQLVETNEVETKALLVIGKATREVKEMTIVDKAGAVKVIDSDTYIAAGTLWKELGDMMDEVSETFDSIIKKAHEAHKDALGKKAKFYKPLEDARREVKKLMSDYDAEQERLRREEENRLREIARKQEEERLMAEALAAEAEGQTDVAEAIINEPVYVAPVVIPKATPKLQGGPVFQTRWDFEITDVNQIPRQYLMPDLVKIRQIVTALKSQANIPGVRAYEKRV